MLRNIDTGCVVAARVLVADSFLTRFKGLMGRRSLPESEGLLLENCSSIHTFFMRFPIDVVFLDKNFRVVGAFPDVKPWRILAGVKGGIHTLELPSGVLTSTGTIAGHRLSYDPASR